MQVPGIGKKGAERLILELRDRLGVHHHRHLARRARRRRPVAGHPGGAVARPAHLRPGRASAGAARRPTARSPSWRPSPTSRSSPPASVEVAVLLRQALQLLGRVMSTPFDRPLTGEVAAPSARTPRCRPQAGDEERVVESALRPHSLHDFIGQPKVARQLDLVLEGAKRRGRPPDHVLLSGPPGLGKTSLALIIGSELGHVGEDHQRAGDRALRRPRRDAVQPRARRRAVHRRDPPHRPARRGTAVHGDGGLPGRRRRRQGAGRDRDPAGDQPVHPGRRDHPGRPAHRPAARPVRLRRPDGVLRARRAAAGAAPAAPRCSASS